MKNWFIRAKLSQQLTLISCACVLIPMLLIWFLMLRSVNETALQPKAQEAELRCNQVAAQMERVSELCNMSTQVFINTPDLVNHLTALKNGEEFSSMELLDFYREDIASLERIILSNPELYQIRVYAAADQIYEMVPILYNRERMEKMPWAKEDVSDGKWYLDYDDRVFSHSGRSHIMGLVTAITTSEAGQVGVVEVSVLMEEILPELFETGKETQVAVLGEDGALLMGNCPLETAPEDTEGYTIVSAGGKRYLVTQIWLKNIGCRYVQFTDLSDLDDMLFKQGLLLLLIVLAGFALMALAISRLTQQMLRGVYVAFEGIRSFAEGNMSATVQGMGTGEVALFTREAGQLLDKIRQLMHDNLEQEIQAKDSEIRALQNQINAHFIYNVLEAIRMMAEIDENYAVADAITSLGKLMRYSMKWESENVTLQRELDYLKNYIVLMNLRFDYIITLHIEVPDELLLQRIPKVSLQPIVENAVVHGLPDRDRDTVIVVKGEMEPDRRRYTITITDEGKGMDEETLFKLRRKIRGQSPSSGTSSGNGIGLHNVQSRIQNCFGAEYGLEITSLPEKGTTVTVLLPYEEKEGDSL